MLNGHVKLSAPAPSRNVRFTRATGLGPAGLSRHGDAMAGRQGLGAVAPEHAVEASDLALAQPEQRGRPAPGQPPLRQLGHNLQPIQFPHRQRHRLRHGAIVSAGRTFLLWRNRTFAFGAHRSTSDKIRYVNFWGSDSFSFFWGSRGAMRTTARRLARVLRAR